MPSKVSLSAPISRVGAFLGAGFSGKLPAALCGLVRIGPRSQLMDFPKRILEPLLPNGSNRGESRHGCDVLLFGVSNPWTSFAQSYRLGRMWHALLYHELS